MFHFPLWLLCTGSLCLAGLHSEPSQTFTVWEDLDCFILTFLLPFLLLYFKFEFDGEQVSPGFDLFNLLGPFCLVPPLSHPPPCVGVLKKSLLPYKLHIAQNNEYRISVNACRSICVIIVLIVPFSPMVCWHRLQPLCNPFWTPMKHWRAVNVKQLNIKTRPRLWKNKMRSHFFMSTVVRLKLVPFNQRIMKSLWQKGQFPTLSASTLAWQTNRHYVMNTYTSRCSQTVTLKQYQQIRFKMGTLVSWFWRRCCNVSDQTVNTCTGILVEPAPLWQSKPTAEEFQMEGWGSFTPRLNNPVFKQCLVSLLYHMFSATAWYYWVTGMCGGEGVFERAGHRFPNWTGLFSVSTVHTDTVHK